MKNGTRNNDTVEQVGKSYKHIMLQAVDWEVHIKTSCGKNLIFFCLKKRILPLCSLHQIHNTKVMYDVYPKTFHIHRTYTLFPQYL